MRELRAILTNYSLAVDHQRKVVKRTLGAEVIGGGGQTFTICGDFGAVCGVYVVPDTSLLWTQKAMNKKNGSSHLERRGVATVPIHGLWLLQWHSSFL